MAKDVNRMKYPRWALSLFAVSALLLVGCAHHSAQVALSEEDMVRLNQEALELASQKLAQLVDESKKQGPSSTRYLATGLFLKGNSALMEGDYVTGAVFFRHLTSLTDDAFVHKKYAVALIRLGQLDEARSVLHKLHQQQEGADESVALMLAGVLTGQEKSGEARDIYRAVLKQNPKQEEACLFLGKSYALEKKWGEAQTQLQQCQKLHPKEGVYSYYLGKMMVDREDLKSAVRFFEESHRRDPASTQSAAALGLIYEQQEKADAAIAVYRRHLTGKPHDSVILSRMVQALFAKEQYAEVIPYAERLVDLDPEDLNMRVRLGILYSETREYEKAISVFRELLQQAPQSDKILYYLGAIHQEIEKFEDAIEYFAQIPATSGLYQDSSFQMASMLSTLAQVEFYQTQKPGKLGESFLKLVDHQLQHLPDLKVELSVLKAGYLEAVEQEQAAIDSLVAVQTEKSFNLQHQYYLAGLWEKVKNYQSSTAVIMAILDKDPKNAHAWNFIGYSMLERGMAPSEALPYIQKALALSPQDGYIRDSLGWYYYKLGRLPEALRELKAALKAVPDDAVIAKHLAQTHQRLRNYSEARVYFEQALKHSRLASEKKEITDVMQQMSEERKPASVQEALAN